MFRLLITMTLCHLMSATTAATRIGIADVFLDTLATNPLDNFWHSTGFTPPSSEPEESAEFLLSRGYLVKLKSSK